MEVQQVLSKWKTPQKVSAEELKSDLKILSSNECWNCYFRVFAWTEPELSLESSIEITSQALRHLVVDLEDKDKAVAYLSKIMIARKLDFETVEHSLVKKSTESDDVAMEGSLLEAVVGYFQNAPDRELALERLCMLFEKRLHRDDKLSTTNERLLELNPRNIQGLRYLKNAALLHQNWNDLVDVLERLLEALEHPEEKLRAALDLAAVYLYQLGVPAKCIAVLDLYATERIDTSKMRYHAYEAMQDWDSCINVLLKSLDRSFDDEERAAVHFYLAKIYSKKEDIREAYINFLKASSFTRDNLAPAEEALKIAIAIGDLGEIINILNHVLEKSHWKKETSERAREIIERITTVKNGHGN
jgi:tetratricopeptide (TPR) repeat protein